MSDNNRPATFNRPLSHAYQGHRLWRKIPCPGHPSPSGPILQNKSRIPPAKALSPVHAAQKEVSRKFWEQWLTHRQYLYHLAMRWNSRNPADAEDAVSKLAVKAHSKYLKDYTRIQNLRAWLARMLHNICMDEHRKCATRHRVLEKLTPSQYSYTALVTTTLSSQEKLTMDAQPMGKLLQTIFDMPMRLRYPFVLRFIYHYSNGEIAQQLELTEVNIRKRIQLGRILVREKVSPGDL